MPQALAFTLSLSLYFLNLIPLFASAAVFLPSISPNNDVSLALSPTAKLNTNLTAVPHGQIRCVLPYPHPIDPVSLRTCQPTIDRLLSYPWIDTPQTYRFSQDRKGLIKITSTFCAISLDRKYHAGEITISLRQILQSVIRILSLCSAYGEGGWQYMDPPWRDWIVIIQGTRDMAVGSNGTIGELEGNLVHVGEEE